MTLRGDYAKLRGHKILKQVLSKFQFKMDKRRPVVLALYDIVYIPHYMTSQLRHTLSQSKNRETWYIHGTDLFRIVRVRVI